MDWVEFDKWCGALCAWREARGEGRDGMRAVLHVIANRAKLHNQSWAQIVYQKKQFSSMTYGFDPQLTLVPEQPDAQFALAFELAESVMNGTDPDLTLGATHYFNPNIVKPLWAADMQKTTTVGNHDFYRSA